MRRYSLGLVLSFLFISLSLSAAQVSYKGFYLGGNIGYGQDYINVKDFELASVRISDEDTTKNKIRLDVQVGYDWQYCDKVVGLVLDTESLRARGGLLYGNHLIFATTGLAFNSQAYTINDGSSFFGKSFSKTTLGWIVGVGTESPLWRNFTIGTNLFYTYFPEKRFSGSLGGDDRYSFKSNASRWSAEISINYRFGDFR